MQSPKLVEERSAERAQVWIPGQVAVPQLRVEPGAHEHVESPLSGTPLQSLSRAEAQLRAAGGTLPVQGPKLLERALADATQLR